MKLSISFACCAVLLGLAPVASPVHAAPLVQRCESPKGEIIYTDVACAALGARPLPMRGELLNRIEAERGREEGGSAAAERSAGRLSASGQPPRLRSPADGCARSATQLAMDLEGAFLIGDLNRVAGSYHWFGIPSQQAQHVFGRLGRMEADTLVQARFYDAAIGGGYAQLTDAGSPAADGDGIMQLIFEKAGTVQTVDMQVHRYRGCYFVRF